MTQRNKSKKVCPRHPNGHHKKHRSKSTLEETESEVLFDIPNQTVVQNQSA